MSNNWVSSKAAVNGWLGWCSPAGWHSGLTQQLVRGSHLVPEGNGGGPVHGIRRQHPTSQYMTQRVGQHQAFTPFDQLARVEAHRGPGGSRRILNALRVQNYGRGAGFF